MDLLVLEMKGASMRQKEHMVLLGKPFMVTTKTVIDVQSGKLTMTVLGETVQLHAYNSIPYPFATSHNQCSFVDCCYLHMSNLSFRVKTQLTWKLHIPRIDGRGDGAKSGKKNLTYLSIGRGSDLNLYFYFFVFCRIRDNAQNNYGGVDNLYIIFFSFVFIYLVAQFLSFL